MNFEHMHKAMLPPVEPPAAPHVMVPPGSVPDEHREKIIAEAPAPAPVLDLEPAPKPQPETSK